MDNWEQEAQAANKLTMDTLRAQGQGQEPVIPAEDLALLNDTQRRMIAEGGYGVTNA